MSYYLGIILVLFNARNVLSFDNFCTDIPALDLRLELQVGSFQWWGGFSTSAGRLAGFTYSRQDSLRLGEVLSIGADYPVYRPVSIGGDTSVVCKIEYRIPPGGGFSMVVFDDAGMVRQTYRDQLRVAPAWLTALNSAFPGAWIPRDPPLAQGIQKLRMSTGVELQYRVPRIDVPVRFYWAYNLLAYEGPLQPPVVLDRNWFANKPLSLTP